MCVRQVNCFYLTFKTLYRQDSHKYVLKNAELTPTFSASTTVVHTAGSDEVEGSIFTISGGGVDGIAEDPLLHNINYREADCQYRVAWYRNDTVSPSKRFVYWSMRRLREVPPECREYYRRLLLQEIKASRYILNTWDVFMSVVDGYRKVKWLLRKFDVPIDESLIPRPYNNFWEETTHEERVWAHRRSCQMKELQALQRDDKDIVFGAHTCDWRNMSHSSVKNLQSSLQGGSPVHAMDMPAPAEDDIRMSSFDEEMSSMLMSSIEDDKLWNPVLRARLESSRARARDELCSFEDEDDDEDRGV